MGFLEFGIFCLIVVFFAWLVVFVAGKIAPGHPDYIDSLIWFLAVLIIVVRLAQAMGLMGHDVQIPKVS